MNALGRALAAHRGDCATCTGRGDCIRYLQIVRDHTAARRIWAGPVAAHTRLDARENV